MSNLYYRLVDEGYSGLTGGTPYRMASAQQIAALKTQYNTSISSQAIQSAAPRTQHINVYLDGTQNNREYLAKGESETNVSQLARLSEQIDPRKTIYLRGIAAQTLPSDAVDQTGQQALGSAPSNIDSIPALAGSLGNRLVDQAYAEIVNRVGRILDEDPNAKIALNLTGFSRGAAEAVALANLIRDRGIPGLYAPGEAPINSLTLFDPVSQTDGKLDVRWPTNLSNPALVLIATAENRSWFPAMPVGPNSIIIPIEGAHSDVGGSFNPDGISAVTLRIAADYIKGGFKYEVQHGLTRRKTPRRVS